ncbi:MAG: carboxylate-amine ligase [Ktedonobacteraceae bacterium]|nr:carboxylate-amine ligase [Ktedonobacteraceae bacterium]
MAASRFTLGVEEELQMVDKHTGQLASRIHTILEKGAHVLGDQIKEEFLQAMLEVITDVCPNMVALRTELYRLRTMTAELLDKEELALISAGTHPSALWWEQVRSQGTRYEQLEEEYQDVSRIMIVCGLHVHVGLENYEAAIPLMNQLRTWLPHLLAISTNSPFWSGRNSGLKSYRAIVAKGLPRSGVPDMFNSTSHFHEYTNSLIKTGCIDNGKRIWWDIRPHPFFYTLEFRVCDMPATIEDELAIAALCQALVAKLTWMYKHNVMTCVLPRHFIEENKWRAMRYGLDAEFVDFVQNRRLSMREAIAELLDFVDDVLDDLNDRREINHLRALLEDSRGTGADRQLAVYEQSSNLQAVTHFLMQQTLQGITSSIVR